MIKSHRVANGLEVATVESYQYGMNLLPMIMFLAALVYLAIGVYNYKKWKMKEVGGAACGDNGSYLPLS